MIKPRQNRFIYHFFSFYIQWLIRKNFSCFHFNRVTFDSSKSILLVANHFSWWDGFFLFYLNQLYFKKKFHVMILEETAKKRKFMKYLGAFSVKKHSKESLESLNFAAELLNDPNNLVLIFPQGKICSSHVAEIIFEKGLKQIVKQTKKQFQFIFSITFVEYFHDKKPSVLSYLTHWKPFQPLTIHLIQQAFNHYYQQVKTHHASKQ